MMSTLRLTLALGLALLSSCQNIEYPRDLPQAQLASFRRAGDFDTYHIGRVGILPVAGQALTEADSVQLQEILFTEFASATRMEIVMLNKQDLAEITLNEPHMKGVYTPDAVIGISKRFRLDGMLVATAINRQVFPPQRLSLQVDLVSSETGMAIWNGGVNLLGDNVEVANGLEAFYGNGKPLADDGWTVSLLSPSQFARFGAWQIAQGLLPKPQ